MPMIGQERCSFLLTAKTAIYAANHASEIADSIADIDNAMKWGFGWEIGPFETWDAIGVRKSVQLMEEKGLVVPSWVKTMLDSGRESFYQEDARGAINYYCQSSKDQCLVKQDSREWKIDILKKEPNKLVVDKVCLFVGRCRQWCFESLKFTGKMNAIDRNSFRY